MALNAIMLITEISMMAIKDCYIELEFLKLDYGCYFTLVCVHGCTHTVCRNVVVVYWWGSFPLSVSNPIFRENWSTSSRFAKLKPKYPTAIVYGHVLHNVMVWDFFGLMTSCFILLLYPLATCVQSLPPAHLCSQCSVPLLCSLVDVPDTVPTVLRSCPYQGCSAVSRAQLLILTSLLKHQKTT